MEMENKEYTLLDFIIYHCLIKYLINKDYKFNKNNILEGLNDANY